MSGKWIEVKSMTHTEARLERLEKKQQELAKGMDMLFQGGCILAGALLVCIILNRISIGSVKREFNLMHKIRSYVGR